MRILLHTSFLPSVGGIETAAWLLARQWVRLGHEVVVVSGAANTPAKPELPFEVWYRPAPGLHYSLTRRADIVAHMNISLKAWWTVALARRPFVAVHHGFYVCDAAGRRDWRERLKLRVARGAPANIAVSTAVARALNVGAEIIPNPYDDSIFNRHAPELRLGGVVFVGRLVSEKGADALLRAVHALGQAGLKPAVTIVGEGPERPALERSAASLGLERQVRFTGELAPAGVAEQLRRHEVLVVPSLWQEAFGIVALEGAACGCVVLGSDSGGLPEAIGPAGLTFRRGDESDLVSKLKEVLTCPPAGRELYRAASPVHLARHRPPRVAARYLEVFERARRGRNTAP